MPNDLPDTCTVLRALLTALGPAGDVASRAEQIVADLGIPNAALWQQLVGEADYHGVALLMAPIVEARLKTSQGVVSDDARRSLFALASRHRQLTTIREAAVNRLLAAFAAADVPVLLLKGAALARSASLVAARLLWHPARTIFMGMPDRSASGHGGPMAAGAGAQDWPVSVATGIGSMLSTTGQEAQGDRIMTESQNAMLDMVPVPVADVKVETIEGELLLYHPLQTKAIYLNPSAAVIWSLCDGRRRISEIIALIGDSYPESKEHLAEEVFATVAQLRDSGVLSAEPG